MQRFSATSSRQFATVLGAFIAGVLVGRLAGAGWGVALGVGQVVFVFVLVAVLMTSPRASR